MSDLALEDASLDTPLEKPLVPSFPYNGWTPDWSLAAVLTGLDGVRWGGPPRLDPLGNLLGIHLVSAEIGAVTLTMPLTDWARGFDGAPVPGMLAVLADATLAAAVLSTLPSMRGLITIELDIAFIDFPRADATRLSCTATTVPTPEGTPVMAIANVEDEEGHLLARATTRCALFTVPDGVIKRPEDVSSEPPDVWEITARAPTRTLAVAGRSVAPEVRNSISGLELLRRIAHGELSLPPIYHLTGVRPVRSVRSEAVFEMPASQWMGSFTLNVQGGMVGLLAEQAGCAAVSTTLEPGESQRLVTLRVGYLRPMFTSGEPLVARASVVHRGQSVAFSSCNVSTSDGKRIAFASATHAL